MEVGGGSEEEEEPRSRKKMSQNEDSCHSGSDLAAMSGRGLGGHRRG